MIKLTPEQRLVQDEARKFASAELEPVAEEIDNNASFPHDIIKKLADLGFLGIVIPEKYEGAELDPLSYCLIIEEISKVCPSVGAILIASNALVAYPLFKYGKESQKSKWLKRLARGEIIGALAITEENGQESIAKKQGANYVISGKKTFIVNAETAELFIVCASTQNGITPFLIERPVSPSQGGKNLEITEKQDSIGMRASGIWNLKFDGVKVAEDDVLCGSELIDDTLSFAGLGIGALSVGIGERLIEETIKYSKQRKQFGKFICEFPLVQDMLVEMKSKIIQAQLLVYSAALGEQDSAMAKLVATEAALFAGIKAIQVYGGYGYTKDYPIERFFRDANVAQVWCGSSTIQKTKIAKKILEG